VYLSHFHSSARGSLLTIHSYHSVQFVPVVGKQLRVNLINFFLTLDRHCFYKCEIFVFRLGKDFQCKFMAVFLLILLSID